MVYSNMQGSLKEAGEICDLTVQLEVHKQTLWRQYSHSLGDFISNKERTFWVSDVKRKYVKYETLFFFLLVFF